jgi:hypothetical protein
MVLKGVIYQGAVKPARKLFRIVGGRAGFVERNASSSGALRM